MINLIVFDSPKIRLYLNYTQNQIKNTGCYKVIYNIMYCFVVRMF